MEVKHYAIEKLVAFVNKMNLHKISVYKRTIAWIVRYVKSVLKGHCVSTFHLSSEIMSTHQQTIVHIIIEFIIDKGHTFLCPLAVSTAIRQI